MDRVRLVLSVLALLLFAPAVRGEFISNQVTVIAKGEIFNVSGAGRIAVSPASVTAAQILGFLDSAGAIYVTRVFPDFNRADTITTNREGEAVKLIDLSEYFMVDFVDSVSWQALDSAWVGTDSFQVLGQVHYGIPHDYPVNDPFYPQQSYLMGSEGSQTVA